MGRLRVTSGVFKGFKLEVPPLAAVRPPLEMVREAIFDILGQDLAGCRVLDLFAGSGIMGIEALSRGAEGAVFVEKHRAAAATIVRNLEKVRSLDKGRVVTGSAFRFAEYVEGQGPLDVVFVDPPFAMLRQGDLRRRVMGIVEALFECGELAEDADVILRAPREASIMEPPAAAELTDQRQYGHSRLLFFGRAAARTDSGGEDCPPEEPEEA